MSGTRVASLNVTKHTTAADLQSFADKLGAGDRLRGRKVEGGYELYAKTGKPGLWSRVTGRQSDARAAIRMTLDNTERNLGGKTLHNVRTALGTGIKSADVKAGALKTLGIAADRSRITRVNAYGMQETVINVDNRGPSLKKLLGSDLGATTSAINSQIRALGRNPGRDAVASAIASELGSRIDALKQDSARQGQLDKLALSSGSALKYDLRQELGKALHGFDHDERRQILDKAFDQISPDLLRNKERADSSIMIDGVRYTKGTKLGEGGFGIVHEYTNTVDGTKVALKTALNFDPNDQGSIDAFKREANAHRAAAGGSPANVVGFVGAVKMNDGQIGVAVSVARHGSAEKATDRIFAAVQSGTLPQNTATAMRLSLLRDMANGLNNLKQGEEGQGTVHFDFKRDNVFIDADGVGLVGDFGLSAKGNRFDFGTSDFPANKMQTSPEFLKTDDRGSLGQIVSRQTSAFTAAVADRFKGLDKTQKKDLLSDCNAGVSPASKRLKNEVSAEKVDAWALGYAAFVTMFGREPLDNITGNLDADKGNRLKSFGGNARAIDVSVTDGSRTDWATQTSGAFAGSTGDPQLDDLINGLLHPDPDQRLTVAQALAHPALAMTSQQVDTARQDLVAFLAAPPQAAPPQANVPGAAPVAPTPPAQPVPPATPAPAPATAQTIQPQPPLPASGGPGPASIDPRTAYDAVMQELRDAQLAVMRG